MANLLGKDEQPQVLVSTTPFYKSKGVIFSFLLIPFSWISGVREFISANPEAMVVATTLWGWLIRYMSQSPLVIK